MSEGQCPGKVCGSDVSPYGWTLSGEVLGREIENEIRGPLPLPQLHPDRDPGNPALHSRFVELNEAYRVLSREESRRNYDHQLHSASPPKSSGSTAKPGCAQQTHRYSTAVLTPAALTLKSL